MFAPRPMYARTRRSGTTASIPVRAPVGARAPARLGRCRPSPFGSSTRNRARTPVRSTRWLAEARSRSPSGTVAGSSPPAPTDVEIVAGPPDEQSFGDRLRGLLGSIERSGGLVVLGSGAIPLATTADRRAFVTIAADDARVALANNRYSADVVAISRVDSLPAIPDLPGDNALPRWLEEVAGYRVDDLRRRWRLGFDLDGPLDLVLIGFPAGGHGSDGAEMTATVEDRLAAVRAVAADRRAEVLVAGRTSATTLGWLERHAAARVRAWVEERGLRAASRLAQAGAAGTSIAPRGPVSILGTLLDRDGPGSLGTHLSGFADAAILDTPRPAGAPPRPRRSRAGRRPRTASPRTCSSPIGSATRGSASSPCPPRPPGSRSCSAGTPWSARASGWWWTGRPRGARWT